MAVRASKKRRKKKKWPFLLLIPLLAIIIAAVVFQGENIEIEGNYQVSDAEIMEIVHWDRYQFNTLVMWLMNKKVKLKDHELVDRVSVEISDPNTVTVHVEETVIVGYFKTSNGPVYCTANGKAVFVVSGTVPELPELTGINVDLSDGRPVETEDADRLEDLMEIGRLMRLLDVVTENLNAEDDGTYTLKIGNVSVLLGKNVYMADKISELSDLIPELEGLSGTLHLEDYDPSRDSIIFTKD